MAILVTGGAGYIGGHMVLELLDQGIQPVILDNLSTGFRWSVPAGVPLCIGDMGDVEFVTRVIDQYGIDAIIHFAAKIVVPESVADPLGYYLNNTVKTRALLAAAVSRKVKHFIFSSTAAVYGNPVSNPVFEDAVPAPMSPYGTSKLMTEYMLRDVAAAHPMTYGVLRYFNVAGADPKGRYGQSTPAATHLIKVAVQTALGQRQYMEIFGQDFPTKDGTGVRDYIHVSDLARAHSAALKHLQGGGESLTVNCGYGTGFSVNEVVDTVRRVTGVHIEARQAPRRAGDPASIVAGAERIRAELGWVPQLEDLGTIIEHAYKWEKMLIERGLA